MSPRLAVKLLDRLRSLTALLKVCHHFLSLVHYKWCPGIYWLYSISSFVKSAFTLLRGRCALLPFPPLLCHYVLLIFFYYTCTVVSCIYAPFAYKPPLHFQLKFLHRYFYLANRPPNHGHATKIATCSFVETPTLSRSPWWSGNARTKPASTEQLRNSPTIASVSASGVSAIAH